jgi:leucyl aminopeptidase
MSALIERQSGTRHSIAIETTDAAHYAATRRRLTAAQRRWLADSGFEAAAGTFALLSDAAGKLVRVLAGVDARHPLAALAALPCSLPEANYHLADEGVLADPAQAALGWALGAYQFNRYRQPKRAPARLAVPAAQLQQLAPLVEATALVRDLVNTPTEDMGPEQLGDAIRQLGKTHKAKVRDWVGDELLKANFPTIHAVGRASHRAPRLIELSWGKREHPRLVLVGKGVCFDTGGLDLKPSSGMLIMKKDMGGAANVLALAQMVMDAKLGIRLRVLIPAVENAVAGNAFRPLDIFKSRKGPTVEIGNTDAEGRLVLADALALADEEKPDLLIDLGTLTGAARVALGPDLPPFYTHDETLADSVAAHAKRENDPLWRMPLWPPYDSWLDSKTADINNAPSGGFAGSITCALFLQRFVTDAKSWLHVDIYGWTPSAKPARPEGGECQAARAIYKLLSERYA